MYIPHGIQTELDGQVQAIRLCTPVSGKELENAETKLVGSGE